MKNWIWTQGCQAHLSWAELRQHLFVGTKFEVMELQLAVLFKSRGDSTDCLFVFLFSFLNPQIPGRYRITEWLHHSLKMKIKHKLVLNDIFMTNLNFWALAWTKCFGLTDFFFKPTINHRRRKVHDYFLLLLCKSSIWFTEKHIFKIIIYFLIHQNVPQIMSFHLRYMMVS